MSTLTTQELTALIASVLDTANAVRLRENIPDRHFLADAYIGIELMKLVDFHGESMMDAILAVDTKAATHAAAYLATEDRNAFYCINPNKPEVACKQIAKDYFDKKNALMTLGMIDAKGSIQQGYNNINAALKRVVTRSSAITEKANDLALAAKGVEIFSQKRASVFNPEVHITAIELNQQLANAGLPSIDKM